MILAENHLSVDINGDFARLTNLRFEDSVLSFDSLTEVALNSVEIDEFEKEQKVVPSKIAEMILSGNNGSPFLSVSISPRFFYFFETPYESKLLGNELDLSIRWEISKLYPESDPAKFDVVYFRVPKSFLFDYERLLVICLKTEITNSLKEICTQSGLRLNYIINSHFASNYLISRSYGGNKLIPSIYIDRNYFSVLLSSRDLVYFFRQSRYNSQEEMFSLLNIMLDELYGFNNFQGIDKESRKLYAITSGAEKIDLQILRASVKARLLMFNPFRDHSFGKIRKVENNSGHHSDGGGLLAPLGTGLRFYDENYFG